MKEEEKKEEVETLEGITWTCFLGQFAAGQGNKEKLSLWGNVFWVKSLWSLYRSQSELIAFIFI